MGWPRLSPWWPQGEGSSSCLPWTHLGKSPTSSCPTAAANQARDAWNIFLFHKAIFDWESLIQLFYGYASNFCRKARFNNFLLLNPEQFKVFFFHIMTKFLLLMGDGQGKKVGQSDLDHPLSKELKNGTSEELYFRTSLSFSQLRNN